MYSQIDPKQQTQSLFSHQNDRNNPTSAPMYPKIYPEQQTENPFFDKNTPTTASIYPQIDPNDLITDNLFPRQNEETAPSPSAPAEAAEKVLLTVRGVIVHLIDKNYSVELACGDFSLLRLVQDGTMVAVLARVADDVQWPLAKMQPVVKLDESHYFFSICDVGEGEAKGKDGVDSLNYGLTIASKGQQGLLEELDKCLEKYCSFSIQEVKAKGEGWEVLDGRKAEEISPADLKSDEERDAMEKRCAAYWTTLAPNVEEYSGFAAKAIAKGSGQVIKGILWCGDVTVDRLKWGNDVLMKKMGPKSEWETSPETLKRIQRVKKVTKTTQKVATGVLSGVVKVTGFFTSSVVNSKAGKKFFNLLPGEMVLASLDGFSKVCDAVEIAGKNVMETSSTVTTGLVAQRYGDDAAKATSEGLGAAGHAFGTAWAVFKIRQALNPKSVIRPGVLAKSAKEIAAKEKKAKKSK